MKSSKVSLSFSFSLCDSIFFLSKQGTENGEDVEAIYMRDYDYGVYLVAHWID